MTFQCNCFIEVKRFIADRHVLLPFSQGPSTLGDGTLLEDAVGGPLPFLFKVLSCGKTLSIQAHPDKTLAAKLNESDPTHYGDANHKPEMAIALTPFEAMCGFRRIEEISSLLQKHPEFAACISNEAKLQVFMCNPHDDTSKRVALQALFNSFMKCPSEVSKVQLQLLLKRIQSEQSNNHPHPHEEAPWERKCSRAILRLAQQFHGDAGAMAPFFLNYLLIAPGESFFMAPNEPHAYVAGEILECMACSDNVVRAGLTPKFKDVDNLVEMLTYSMGGPSIDVGTPAYKSMKLGVEEDRIMRYTPPVPEFEVMILTCHPGEELTMPSLPVPAIFIVIEGSGSTDNEEGQRLVMRPGRSYYVPEDCPPLKLSVNDNKHGPLKIALAHENLHTHEPTSIVRVEASTYPGEFAVHSAGSRAGSVCGSAPNSPMPRRPLDAMNGSSGASSSTTPFSPYQT
jgi:mannose-6-phosphate isomerase